jgi:polyisoprenoid-binding protein YceI
MWAFNAHSAEMSTFKIDKGHSQLIFEVDHLVISTVVGRFDDFDGELSIDKKSKELLSINGKALATSINTNEAKRDKHLRSADFLDADKHPELTFSASGLKLKAGAKAKVKGKLKIRGITKEVEVDLAFKGLATDPWGAEKIVVKAESTIDRKDFGLKWNEALETGGVLVGESVKIIVSAEGNLKP